jgi:hypothetical protein
MSYLNISSFIEAGKKSLEENNYWSALSIALMLPSMCSRLEYEGNKEYQKQSGDAKDKKCYVDWCNEYLTKDKWLVKAFGDNCGEALYGLRCDIVHAGYTNAPKNKMYFSYGDNCTDTILPDYKIINIKMLCEVILSRTNTWYNQSDSSNMKYTRTFDMTNGDDALLYRKLCEEERAKRLMEDFKKENENK